MIVIFSIIFSVGDSPYERSLDVEGMQLESGETYQLIVQHFDRSRVFCKRRRLTRIYFTLPYDDNIEL